MAHPDGGSKRRRPHSSRQWFQLLGLKDKSAVTPDALDSPDLRSKAVGLITPATPVAQAAPGSMAPAAPVSPIAPVGPDKSAATGAAPHQLHSPPRWFPRPILVRLHGPDLLVPPNLKESHRDQLLPNVGSRHGARDLALHAMSEIGLALHRSLCEEMAHSFMEHAAVRNEDEVAAQFQIELDQAPEPSRLLQLFKVIERDKDGVLLRPTCVLRKWPIDRRNPLKQAYRELVALTTAYHLQAEIGYVQ